MSDEQKPKPEAKSPIFPKDVSEYRPDLPYKTVRLKRRRKGQLNDGEWAPGYGPDAKKK